MCDQLVSQRVNDICTYQAFPFTEETLTCIIKECNIF